MFLQLISAFSCIIYEYIAYPNFSKSNSNTSTKLQSIFHCQSATLLALLITTEKMSLKIFTTPTKLTLIPLFSILRPMIKQLTVLSHQAHIPENLPAGSQAIYIQYSNFPCWLSLRNESSEFEPPPLIYHFSICKCCIRCFSVPSEHQFYISAFRSPLYCSLF